MLSPQHLEHLGTALRELRGASGASQAEVCARAGLVRPQVSRWENDHDVPTLESLIKYLSAFGSSLAALELELLSQERAVRSTAVNREIREIRAGHARRIRSSTGLAKAEEELLYMFELRARGEDPQPAELATTLGRLALVAADAERATDLATYAAQAARITKAADREWPLPVFIQLWNTVMADARKPALGIRVARALFRAVSDAYHAFEDQPWELALEIEDGGLAGTEIRLECRGPLTGLAAGAPDEPVVRRFGGGTSVSDPG